MAWWSCFNFFNGFFLQCFFFGSCPCLARFHQRFRFLGNFVSVCLLFCFFKLAQLKLPFLLPVIVEVSVLALSSREIWADHTIVSCSYGWLYTKFRRNAGWGHRVRRVSINVASCCKNSECPKMEKKRVQSGDFCVLKHLMRGHIGRLSCCIDADQLAHCEFVQVNVISIGVIVTHAVNFLV